MYLIRDPVTKFALFPCLFVIVENVLQYQQSQAQRFNGQFLQDYMG